MSTHAARARSGQDRTSLYDEITDKIIAELEAGRAPWVQPWGTAAAKAPLAMPRNAATHRRYSGINVLILWGAVIEHGFAGQSWLTFRQALEPWWHMCEKASTARPSSTPTASPREDERRRARGNRRGSAGDSVPEAIHRLQHGSMRGPARARYGSRAAASRPISSCRRPRR